MLFNSESVGFHGTSRLAMGRILKREIIRSDQNFEWLGTGFYVWQDSPWLARQWARMRHSELAAVVAVRIDLDGCLDLFHPRWQWEGSGLRDDQPVLRGGGGEWPSDAFCPGDLRGGRSHLRGFSDTNKVPRAGRGSRPLDYSGT